MPALLYPKIGKPRKRFVMSIFISTNTSALRAGYHLAKSIRAQNNSIDRLSSGKKIRNASDDAGGLAVSIKLNSTIKRIDGAMGNVQNAISYLEVQDGALQTVGQIVERMGELKSLATHDPMKSSQDKASYNNEFQDLQEQLYQISQTEFNGVSLFARYNDGSPFVQEVWFMSDHDDWVYGQPNSSWDHTQTIYTSGAGSGGSKVSIHKLPLLSALTIDNHYFEENFNAITPELGSVPYGVFNSGNASANGDESTSFIARFAVDPNHEIPFFRDLLDLADLSVAVFVKALENVSFLRAQNGGSHSRLSFSLDSLNSEKNLLSGAHSRIVDSDIAEETTNLAKEMMFSRFSATILTQANSNAELALLLLN
jgi:flagellin-like hook-associated protein FlgL